MNYMTSQQIIDILCMARKSRELSLADCCTGKQDDGYMLFPSVLSYYERRVRQPTLARTVLWADAVGYELVLRKKR